MLGESDEPRLGVVVVKNAAVGVEGDEPVGEAVELGRRQLRNRAKIDPLALGRDHGLGQWLRIGERRAR